MICRFNTNFPLSFLEWKLNRNINENCYSLNFDYYDAEMSILQKSITPDSNGKLNTDLSSFNTIRCFTVFFGGKYLKRLSDIVYWVEFHIKKGFLFTRPSVYFAEKTNVPPELNKYTKFVSVVGFYINTLT